MDPLTTVPRPGIEEEPAEHFSSLGQQEHAAHFGMWLFLTSETLLFGALFGLYTGYRIQHGREFVAAAQLNNAVQEVWPVRPVRSPLRVVRDVSTTRRGPGPARLPGACEIRRSISLRRR